MRPKNTAVLQERGTYMSKVISKYEEKVKLSYR